nr:nucleotidyltransferase family protein [Pseudomonas baltica]
MRMPVEQLLSIAMTNPLNAEITARLPSLGLDQCMLTAGCLFQAVWNHQSNLPPEWGVKDYDVFYFDEDVSWEAENEVINRARSVFQDLGVDIEFKNQARVHLWYGQRFGRPYPPLQSAKDGIDRYLVAGTCIGLDVCTREVYAPYGLDDLQQGLLRINPANPEPDLFIQKARSYQARWPWLTILDYESHADVCTDR